MKRGTAILCAMQSDQKADTRQAGRRPHAMVGDLDLNHAERIIQTYATRSVVMEARSLR